MQKYNKNIKIKLTVISITLMMTLGVLLPLSTASNNNTQTEGYDKGPSGLPVVPMKKTTLIGHDENSLLDDYAYLSAVPTAVFKENNQLYSHPLLFYQDLYEYEEEKERSLNAHQGLDYFMEDYMSYCNGRLDQMTTINVEKSKVSQWHAKEYVEITGDNPYDIASDIALQDFSYSDDAVISVIEESYGKTDEKTDGTLSGSLPDYKIETREFNMEKPDVGIGGNYQPFKITDEKHKYLVVEATWNDASEEVDLQIYDDQIGLVSANMESSFDSGAEEIGGAYIRNLGDWEIGLTAFPKKTGSSESNSMYEMFQSSNIKNTGLFSRFSKQNVNVEVKLLPGVEVALEENIPYGCREAKFTLKWDNSNADLGFAVIDPSGAEIATSLTREEIVQGEIEGDSSKAEASIDIVSLGECLNNENYKICVFSINEISSPVDFTVEYEWTQKYSKKEGYGLDSATNGAVLASQLNAPLLYTEPSEISQTTKDVLYKLGVKNIYIVNFGDYLSDEVTEDLKDFTVKKNFVDSKKLYDHIKGEETKGQVVFTTIESFKAWYAEELKPADEKECKNPYDLYIGPSAFIAAHHNTPVIILDNHPKLAKAAVYHKNFWGEKANHVQEPSLGDMVLTGREVYDFLEEIGFDKKGNNREEGMETIITVAGQYNIGPTWDRTFVGAAKSGRFWFSPTDVSSWISRNIFYPALIFENPAMQGKNSYINGSESTIARGLKGLAARLIQQPRGVNLVVTKESGEEKFEYPILESFLSGAYKFNQQAENYWGCTYTRADGITPYFDPSPDPIDNGATDKVGAYYPDLDDTNVVPFYGKKAGYGNVFSTNFEAVVENLNRGVIMFVQDSHGYHQGGGEVDFWDPDNPYVYEENPWRAYEPVMWKLGHLRTFLHWLLYYGSLFGSQLGLPENLLSILETLSSIRPIKFQLFSEVGSTETPDEAVLNPDRANLKIAMFNFISALRWRFHPERIFNREPGTQVLTFGGDGMITTSKIPSGAPVVAKAVSGYEFDDALENMHSCGIQTVVCLPAGTYLQMTWIRHGATYTVMDPWGTSDYCAVWLQSIIKNIAMGDTIGEAYEKGIRACAPELLVDHWWWDTWENVCFFGDPDLRVFVPSTEYSYENHWTQEEVKPVLYDSELNLNGHMPFGATSYPNEREPEPLIPMWALLIVIIILVAIVLIAFVIRSKAK